MPYSVSPKGYLARARDGLLSNRREDLFYAAFELRCCVEQRQAEYVEALKPYAGKRVRAWKVGENQRKIRSIMAGEQISEFEWFVENHKAITYHTPVGDRLINIVEGVIGNLLHCQSRYRSDEDIWWKETRSALISAYRLAWVSCQGQSLTPPLWDGKGKSHPVLVEGIETNDPVFSKLIDGTHFTVKIAYLNEPPENWICDL